MIESLIANWPVVVEVPVVWGEMDSYQHVNNAVYFRYLENARIAYMDRLGWSMLEEQTGVGVILASVQAKFRRPLTYPDTISITARVTTLGEDRFTIEHVIVSHRQKAITTEGSGVVVTYHYGNLRKVPVPEEMRRRIVELEGREPG